MLFPHFKKIECIVFKNKIDQLNIKYKSLDF